MQLAAVTLEDKYTLQSGRIYLSVIQALVHPTLSPSESRPELGEGRRLEGRTNRRAALQ